MQAYLHNPGQPVWSERRYQPFADEGYVRNVIAHRAINLVASGAASIDFKLFDCGGEGHARCALSQHPLLSLLKAPQGGISGRAFIEALVSYRLISGNAYILAVGPDDEAPSELHLLRPDRMSIISGKNGYPAAYRHTVGNHMTDYPVHPVTQRSRVFHLKAFHPLNDYYGLSPMEAAAYSIDMHNQANSWNQSLMQNAARPSGALIVKTQGDSPGRLSEDQYYRIKQQVDEQFSGAANAGRPLLLEGGLEWKEMSLSPREMDYISAKHSAARDIALAFGVPPQLLGIPGDNTYSNLAEARLGLWEQTIIPLMQQVTDGMNGWLAGYYPGKLELALDMDGVSALSLRQEKLWKRVESASFLSDDEKRALVGMGEKEYKKEKDLLNDLHRL
ncbi:MAG: phage portal protein [Rickettsiales bacterium]|nr:phage portal protein [Rickettsiales bacterium]